jgi:hypothetical protein
VHDEHFVLRSNPWLEISRHLSFKDVIQQKCTMTVLEDIK